MANKRFGLGMLILVLVAGLTIIGCDMNTTPDDTVGDFDLYYGVPVPPQATSHFFRTSATTWTEETPSGVVVFLFVFDRNLVLNGVDGIVLRRNPDTGIRFFVPSKEDDNNIFRYQAPNATRWNDIGVVVHR